MYVLLVLCGCSESACKTGGKISDVYRLDKHHASAFASGPGCVIYHASTVGEKPGYPRVALTPRRTPMLSRRRVVIGAAAAGAAALVQPLVPAFAAASQPSTRVNFSVPVGACDCHTHIFGDSRRFPFAPSRIYTPEHASINEMRSLHRALHTDRVVIVHPIVYGTDNSCTLDAIKQLSPGARGIVVIEEKTSDAVLDEMHQCGVRGIRINLETAGQADPSVARRRL